MTGVDCYPPGLRDRMWFERNDMPVAYKCDSRGERMKVEERVAAFLKEHAGDDFCDDCLAKKVGLPNRREARSPAIALATTEGFERVRQEGRPCSVCGTPHHSLKWVTRGKSTTHA